MAPRGVADPNSPRKPSSATAPEDDDTAHRDERDVDEHLAELADAFFRFIPLRWVGHHGEQRRHPAKAGSEAERDEDAVDEQQPNWATAVTRAKRRRPLLPLDLLDLRAELLGAQPSADDAVRQERDRVEQADEELADRQPCLAVARRAQPR